MRIGTLDTLVRLFRTTQAADAAGGIVDELAPEGEAWARIVSQKGEESFKAAQQTASRSIKLQLRFRADIGTDWAVEWNGDVYDIVDVDRSLRRRGELWLMATLRTGA